jgi:hypothetical protein
MASSTTVHAQIMIYVVEKIVESYVNQSINQSINLYLKFESLSIVLCFFWGTLASPTIEPSHCDMPQ